LQNKNRRILLLLTADLSEVGATVTHLITLNYLWNTMACKNHAENYSEHIIILF